jgi:heme-degrading monooxygenase HmoA
MGIDAASKDADDQGATIVITHKVREGRHGDYEDWLKEIIPVCQAWPGFLDRHIVRPIPGLTETYTVIIRFDTEAHLRGWLESSDRARLIEKVRPLFVTGDDFFVSSGLDFWFTPGASQGEGTGTLEAVPGDLVCHLPVGTGCAAGGRTHNGLPGRPHRSRPDDALRDGSRGLPDGLCGHAALHQADPALAIHLTLMHLGREAPPMMKDNGGAVALGRGRDIF